MIVLKYGTLTMAIGVMLGAFGAHGLKNFATPKALELWQTATLYLFIHGLGILLVGVLVALGLSNKKPAVCFGVGILLFSGSLYAMALGAPRFLGAITPMGGTLFIIGWLWLFFTLTTHSKSNSLLFSKT